MDKKFVTIEQLKKTANNILKKVRDKGYSTEGGGGEITIDSAMSSSSENPVQNKVITNALSGKVDKVSGKGLSTNDFTNADKDAISQFSGLVIDYGVASGSNWNRESRQRFSFNKTFSSIPMVFCTYKGSGYLSSDGMCAYCRVSDVSLEHFYIEIMYGDGSGRYSGGLTKYIMWFAIGT